MAENKEVVLSVKNLAISFKTDRGIVKAVRGVSFDLYKGETLCIVGESGSGKSVTNKAIMGISAANAIIEHGSIMYEGEDLIRVSEEEFHRIRGHKIGMIFQDPLSALNPVMKIGKQITEATLINRDILKRHFRDLISKELVKYRNAKTNYAYDIELISNELEFIKTKTKEFNKLSKNQEKNAEQINKLTNEINKKVSDSKVRTKSEIERLDKKDVKLKEKIEKLNQENGSELKKNIAEIEEKTNLNLREVYKTFFEKSEHIHDWKEYFVLRKEFLSSLLKATKESYKEIKPLLKHDLAERKKSAKLENNEYAKTLEKEHLERKGKLEDELSKLESELTQVIESLTDEEKKKIEEVNAHNKLARKKLKKASGNINISKTTHDDSLVILKTEIEKYDNLLERIDEAKKAIQKENEEYINSTKITKAEAKRMALEVMKEVGIPMPEKRFKQYPFEFSGGMRQRIVIAIALTANPDILICDEPTTALDVTIQAQILELINKLKRDRHLSCIFITHDLGVVANMADRVAVMYAGKIVEYGLANEVFFDPRHPYTWALLSSIPDVDSKEKLEAIPGTPPDMLNPPQGDAFALRSKYAMAIDFKYEPPFFKVSDTHYAATWLLYPGAPQVEMPRIVKTRIENALREKKEKENKEAN